MASPQSARPPAAPDPPANYLDLYGLSKPPFGSGADSTGYILFGTHRRAFELLVDHIVNGTGILILLGQSGVGKTETLRSAAAVAAESGRQTVIVSRPPDGRVTLNQLVLAINGQPVVGPVAINDAITNFEQPPRKVIIADDIELMPDDCIGLLLSLRQKKPDGSGSSAVIMSSSIELTGDPARPDLAQLSSLARNTIRMTRLTPAEIHQYIERSLWISGGATRRLITSDAMKMLIARSGGLPGMVNRLLEASFTAGFGRGDAMITVKTVTAAVGPMPPRSQPRPIQADKSSAAGTALHIISAGLLVTGASVFLYKALTTPVSHTSSNMSGATVQKSVPAPPQPSKAEQSAAIRPPDTLPPELVAALLKRGNEVFDLGDIAAARLLFQRAAAAGNAAAATALGKTYDPNIGSTSHTRDATRAAEWYQRAIMLGDPKAVELLKRLPPG